MLPVLGLQLVCRLDDDLRVVGLHYLGPNAGEVTQVRILTAAVTAAPAPSAENVLFSVGHGPCSSILTCCIACVGMCTCARVVRQGFATALRLGATYEDIYATVGIHPTTAEKFTTLTYVPESAPPGACDLWARGQTQH